MRKQNKKEIKTFTGTVQANDRGFAFILPDDKEIAFLCSQGKDPTATDASHIHRDPPDAATAQAKAGRYVRLFLRGTWFLLAEPRPLIDGAFPKQPLLTI